jgi:hypothetical protein
MSIIQGNALSGSSGYTISRSLRFRSSASAYLSRTPASASGQNQWTFSTWVKRSTGTFTTQQIIGGNTTSSGGTRNILQVEFSADNLWVYGFTNASGYYFQRVSTAVYRDPAAWYHLVVQFDPDNATSANKVIAYINGQQVSWGTSSDSGPAGNIGSSAYRSINNTFRNDINGGYQGGGAPIYFGDGYQTEINMISGSIVSPNSFGAVNVYGSWSPVRYTGTYGTNGFYLPFSNNASTTTLGNDFSGNSNNWTTNNISLTAGTTYDSMTDVPTLTSATAANYAVLNPLALGTSQTSLTQGNLYAIPTSGGSNWGTVFSTIAIPTSGKWYIEATAVVYAGSGNNSSLGVVNGSTFIPTNTTILYNYTTGEGFDGILCQLFSDYVAPVDDGVVGTNVTGITGTSVNLMLALDVDAGKVFAGYNGTWLNSGNPAAGTGQVALRTFSASDVVAGNTSWNGTNDQAQYFNFGQRPFTYTPPSGFVALNTFNL